MTDIEDQIRKDKNYKACLEDFKSKPNVALFIGAGLSRLAGYPSWEALINDLRDNLKEKQALSDDKLEAIDDLIKKREFLYAAELIKKGNDRDGNNEFNHCIHEIFSKAGEYPTRISDVFTKLADNLNLIVTTNYDTSLDSIMPKKKTQNGERDNYLGWEQYTYTQCSAVRKCIETPPDYDKCIFHIHGQIGLKREEKEPVILAYSDYQNLYLRDREFNFLLSRLLDTYTFLFIGFSMTDPFFARMLDELATNYKGFKKVHYALMNNLPKGQVELWDDLRTMKIIRFGVDEAQNDQCNKTQFEIAYGTMLEGINDALNNKVLSGPQTEIGKPRKYSNLFVTLEWWGNSGGNPQFTDDNGDKVVRVHYTLDSNGIPTNCSMHHRILPIIKKGETVVVSVESKCSPTAKARLFVGDAGGRDPYDNEVNDGPKFGTGNWETLTVVNTYSHDDICMIFLYGYRDESKQKDEEQYVLYKNLEVEIYSADSIPPSSDTCPTCGRKL